MPVAGSSLIHPHAQLISTSNAPNLMRRELEASKHYRERRGSTFWEDLTAWEAKSGERYLGKIGRTHFMTTYAPIGVAGDVLAVVEDARCTLDLDPQDLHDLSSGIARAITVYDTMGIYSFNLAFFTGTPADDHFRFHLLFSPRTYFSPQLGTPDTNAMRNLFNETLCMAFPEEINERLKKGFEGKLP